MANSYLPSNWLSALGLYAWAQVDESSDNNSLINPARKFTYVAPKDGDDTYVVFIIGETTRWDHMGIFGYERNTTPKLAQEKSGGIPRLFLRYRDEAFFTLYVCTGRWGG